VITFTSFTSAHIRNGLSGFDISQIFLQEWKTVSVEAPPPCNFSLNMLCIFVGLILLKSLSLHLHAPLHKHIRSLLSHTTDTPTTAS